MIVVIGCDGNKFYTFEVRVAGQDEVEEIDACAANETQAYAKAKAEADRLYQSYTLQLVSVV